MTYLIKTTEQYRCDTEQEAVELIESAKKAKEYELIKYNSEVKLSKQKGEVVDTWMRVSLVKAFTDEKEPDGFLMPKYTIERDREEDED